MPQDNPENRHAQSSYIDIWRLPQYIYQQMKRHGSTLLVYGSGMDRRSEKEDRRLPKASGRITEIADQEGIQFTFCTVWGTPHFRATFQALPRPRRREAGSQHDPVDINDVSGCTECILSE